ncbi:MAG: uroporphyrinogen-III synthase [Gammaproteobacteria bacterium]|nr:uroporphyrinogen-III synthase [Gammaproteobacteria bacterium]MCW5582524.1 uroporphyrinogen-III synthase [Gammaproteobacteria bacterium]
MNNLCGLHILVTRPAPQGLELCQLITAHGGHAINFPTIAFAPPPDPVAFQKTVNVLGEQEWLIFISPQAVYSSVLHIRKAWPIFPYWVKFAAVGAGTAKALHEAGYDVSVHPLTEWNSEGLLDLPEFQPITIAEKKIAIIRGVGGREWLDKVLAERGAHVLPVIAYERTLPQVDVNECAASFVDHKIDVIVCASNDGIRNLKLLLGERIWPLISVIPLVVLSQRMKMLAQDLGFQRIWVTRNASQIAILEAMVENRTE